MNNALVKAEQGELAPIPAGGITIEQAFEAARSKTLDKESLQVMKDLLAMDAERKFTSSFVQLQSELPVIVAKSIIPNRGKYEKFEDIMGVVQPILQRHGFCVSFSQEQKDGRVIATCHLMHISGHTSSKAFAVRTGGRSDSETQADCKASTTAKRNSLILSLNLTIRQDCLNSDEDVSIEGDPNATVTQEQADELEHRVKMLTRDTTKFLAYSKAKTFAEIPARLYAELDAQLSRLERGQTK